MHRNLIRHLEERGLIAAVTDSKLDEICSRPIKLYIGFDPTADSLHLGHLVALVMLKWFQKFGHTPHVLIGQATGRIGDPSGKSKERPLLDSSTLELNILKIRRQFESLIGKVDLLNNNDWCSGYPLVDFLRDIGKHFRVNVMLTKESVKARLASEEGISFTEFSYQVLQAFDFYYLFKTNQISLQIGGADQWGNIVAGIELIRKILGQTAYGVTYPLLIGADGKKFGKSEGKNVWLSADRLSPYDFYQYLYRVDDADVIKFMKMLTCMEMDEIGQFEKKMKDPSYKPNLAQKRLAEELTKMVHGEGGLQSALRATSAVEPGKRSELNRDFFQKMMKEFPYLKWKKTETVNDRIVDILFRSGLVLSKGEGSRLIVQGGVYLNNRRIEDPQECLNESSLVDGAFLLLAIGKKKKLLIYLV